MYLARDGYTCRVCKKKGGKLHVHHILYRSRGASDNPKYMAAVCSKCHTTENHLPGGILYQWMQDQKKFTRGLRDATFMNILKKRLRKGIPRMRYFTYGNITKGRQGETGTAEKPWERCHCHCAGEDGSQIREG